MRSTAVVSCPREEEQPTRDAMSIRLPLLKPGDSNVSKFCKSLRIPKAEDTRQSFKARKENVASLAL